MASSKNVWSVEETTTLKKLYGSAFYKDLLVYLPGKTVSQLASKVKWEGIADRQKINKLYHNAYSFEVNDNFFSNYTPLSCYYAGLLAADGCMVNERLLQISLDEADKEYLEIFKKVLKFQGNVLGPYKGDKTSRMHYTLQISSSQMVLDLKNNFQITSNKTFLLEPPLSMPNQQDLYLSYIAGLIDGDGCINSYKGFKGRDIAVVEISGTKSLLEWVKIKIDNLIPSSRKFSEVRKIKNAQCYEYRIGSSRALRFVNLVQKLELPFFKRKWGNLIEMKNIDV